MNKYFFSLLFVISVSSWSQQGIKTKSNVDKNPRKSVLDNKVSANKQKALINAYTIFSLDRDTTYVDTTLTINKDYRYNYLRKDNFNLLQFANTGQTYNSLSIDKSSNNTLPRFAAQARHFNYLEVDDVNYYRVPTPLTELYYKTVFSQGQNLDAFFTVNISPQVNFSIAYKGLRSLGNYQNALTSTGNFSFTTNYQSKNEKYRMRGHITFQDLFSEENGGLTDEDVQRFIAGDEEIQDRSVFDPNFENALNTLEGKRFHLEQSFIMLSKKDSLSSNEFFLENTLSFQDKFYRYNQSVAENDFYGASFRNEIEDRVTLEEFYSDVGLSFKNDLIGRISIKLNYNSINYGYDSLVFLDNQFITNRIKDDFFGILGAYSKQIGKLKLDASIGGNLSESTNGNYLDVSAKFRLTDNIQFFGGLNLNNRLSNYNHLLYQSDYTNYNWDNQDSFDTVNTQQLSFGINSNKLINAQADITNINNYTYFSLVSVTNGVKEIKPIQHSETLQYFRLKVQKEIKIGKFALDNTVMYQKVTNNDAVFNVPDLITRNTLYYTDEVFKKALKFQTGITLNYFTKYNGNGYDPLLAEFYAQNETEIGGFPRLDFFINAKIRQTRIFIKAEHFNSSFTGYDYFSAPNHPYRDFTVRFGLVWNFFL